jgi:ribonuclease R/exosome complex exonuclease DIS3/RRP44
MIKENEKVGQIDFLNNGNAYVKTDENTEVFIFRKNTLNALHLDTVRISIFERKGKKEGKVEEVVSRFKTQFVGTTQRNKKVTFVIPDNSKCPVDFLIPEEYTMGALDKQKVVIEFYKWKEGSKSPYGKIVKILGEIGDNNVEMNSIMYEYGLPVDFPPKVEAEAENISFDIPEEEIKKRRDMRDVLTFTIDPVDAKDFDDALSIKKLDNGNYEIGIHIADVTHYVKPGSLIDKEAINRSTSVYLVDRCIPMLPHKLSNGVCSLRPHEDKLCYSVVVKMNENGDVLDRWFGRTVIYSNHRFTYEQAQACIEAYDKLKKKKITTNDVSRILAEDAGLGNMSFLKAGDLSVAVLDLNRLSKKLRDKRSDSIRIDGAEVRFKLDDSGKPLDVYFKIQKESNHLIEEFMLLANQEVAMLLSKNGYNSIYRIHDAPNEDKIESLKNVCANFGYVLDTKKENIKKSLNKLLEEIKGKPEENMIKTLITRCMSKAVYSSKNIGHYGLGFQFYTHFTSPIRRYADCIAHRKLTEYLEGKPKFDIFLEESCEKINVREVAADKAQRDSIKYKQAEYLQDKIGSTFKGMVSGITDWAVYVEIIENKCEGMIRLGDISSIESYSVDTSSHRVVGDKSGNVIRLGDEVMVSVKSINLDKKTIDFNLIL